MTRLDKIQAITEGLYRWTMKTARPEVVGTGKSPFLTPSEADKAINSLISEECLKARLIELDLLEQAMNAHRNEYEYKMERLKDLTTRLDAIEKEQSHE